MLVGRRRRRRPRRRRRGGGAAAACGWQPCGPGVKTLRGGIASEVAGGGHVARVFVSARAAFGGSNSVVRHGGEKGYGNGGGGGWRPRVAVMYS